MEHALRIAINGGADDGYHWDLAVFLAALKGISASAQNRRVIWKSKILSQLISALPSSTDKQTLLILDVLLMFSQDDFAKKVWANKFPIDRAALVQFPPIVRDAVHRLLQAVTSETSVTVPAISTSSNPGLAACLPRAPSYRMSSVDVMIR